MYCYVIYVSNNNYRFCGHSRVVKAGIPLFCIQRDVEFKGNGRDFLSTSFWKRHAYNRDCTCINKRVQRNFCISRHFYVLPILTNGFLHFQRTFSRFYYIILYGMNAFWYAIFSRFHVNFMCLVWLLESSTYLFECYLFKIWTFLMILYGISALCMPCFKVFYTNFYVFAWFSEHFYGNFICFWM